MADDTGFQRRCTVAEKNIIIEKIQSSEYKRLMRLVGLKENEIDEIETNCRQNNEGFRETVYQLLVKWEQKKADEATAENLILALDMIQRNDIIRELFPDSCQRISYPLNKLQKEIQQRQEKQFANLNLPRCLWLKKKCLLLENLYVELSLTSKNDLGEDENKSIQHKEIFNGIDDKIPHRILIEGNPGYGKTTLIAKLLFDWSSGEIYIRKKFDLVFVIPLRNHKGILQTQLLQQIKWVKGSEEEKLKAIDDIQGRVLLLLDGLDEASQMVKESLLPLVRLDQYPNMTVIVTSRTGFIDFSNETEDEFEPMGIVGFEKHLIWEKRIQIKGISLERRYEFLQKYLNIDASLLDEKLSQSKTEITDFYECPLFLLLLAVLIQEGKIKTIRTKTELFKSFFNFLINRNLVREKIMEERTEIDVFDLTNKIGCQNLLINFGQLGLEKIKKHSLIFEENEILHLTNDAGTAGSEENLIIRLGFLSKQLSFFNYEEKEHYEPIHKTFLEFLTAFYLSSLNENEMEKELSELVLTYQITSKADEFLYPFLAGLLQTNAVKMFKILSTDDCIKTLFKDNYNLRQILYEIPLTNDICKSLIPFCFTDWRRVGYDDYLHDLFTLLYKCISPSEQISVEHFWCKYHEIEKRIFIQKLLLRFKNLKRLSCTYHLICDFSISDITSIWQGFKTVEQLDLEVFHDIEDKSTFYKGISFFKNVKIFHLDTSGDFKYLSKCASLLPCLKKMSVHYHRDSASLFSCNFIMDFITNLNSVKGNERKRLDELEIKGLKFDKEHSSIVCKCLEECFVAGAFLTFSFPNDLRDEAEIVKTYFSSLKTDYFISEQKEEPKYFTTSRKILEALKIMISIKYIKGL